MFHKKIKNASFDPNQLKRHKIYHRIWRDPYVDWPIIFFTAVFLAAYVVFTGVSTYNFVKDEIAASATATIISPTTIDTESLSIVLERYEDRAKERAELQRGYGYSFDPSN